MPRGSASGKRQQGPAAASHAKHDNGLVTPGRKVLRSKNNPHPDTARSKPPSQTATTASPPRPQQKSIAPPSSPLNGNLNGRAARLPAANGRHSNGSAVTNGFPKLPDYDDDDNMAIGHRSHPARRSSLGADSETSASADSFHSQHQNHHHGRNVNSNSSHHNGNGHHDHHLFSDSALATHEPREIDVNASKYAGDVHRDPGPLDYATTVLMSLPLHDTLAILLILMHVSPLTLSVIYTVFTVLTFASPLTAHSVVNVHLAELLDWHSTMPSLVTVLCVDVLALMVFLFLWPSVQNAILDLAKPVIAATLGGGSSSRGGQSRTVSACFSIMIGTHVFKNTRGYWSRFIQLLPPSWRISPDTDDPLEDASSIGAAASLIRNPQPYFTILGLHILMQGVVRYIREWYIRRERISAASASHAGDPEAGKPTPTSTDPADPVHALDGGEPPIASATTAHGTSTSSTKRRRKQSAQVRLQQPLWAALASTKVVMVKEYELSHATSEAASPGATDIHNLGNAPFDREGGKIWISYVGCDEVSFDTSPFPDDFSDDGEAEAPPSPGCDSGRGMSTTTIDRSRPFYVKINNAHWLSTRVEPAGDEVSGEAPADVESSRSEAHGGPQGTRWTGDIYGLRPMSKYVCQFVDSRTDEVLFMTNITTTREQTKNSAAAAAAAAAITNGMPNGQRRSHSPTTTLKTSIAASDAKLAAERTKLKILRREWKVKVNALRKENEGTDHAINSAGGTDDRFRQKIRQQETQKAQSEKEAKELADELRAFESAWPGDAAERRKRTEERWAAEKRAYENGQKELKRHSATVGSAVKAREADRQQLQTRRNKTASRVGKVDSELANIADANERGLNEAERRRLEREAWQARVSTAEEKMKADFGALQADNAALQDQHEAAMKQAKALHTQLAYAAATAVGFEQGGVAAALAGVPSPAQYPTVSWAASNPPAPAPAMPPSLYGPNHQWTAEAGLTAGSGGAPQWRFPMQLAAQHALAGQQQQPQQHHSQLPPPPGFRSRGRSSSMLSDVSGFTQLSGEEQAATFMMRGAAPGRPGRGSLGGSSGSGSGSSTRDPASPA